MTKNWYAAVAVLASVACVDTLKPLPDREVGVILLTARKEGSGHRLEPEALFFRSSDVAFPNSGNPADACTTLPYSPVSVGNDLDDIPAGTPITLTMGGVSTTMTPRQEDNDLVYRPVGEIEVAHNPGDTAFLDIPGATGGYPPTTAASRTAETFTFATVTAPPAGQGLSLSWTTTPQAGSAMAFSLQYAVASETNNRQLYCELIDDGSFIIPTAQLEGFRNSDESLRAVAATRFRTTTSASGRSVLLILSRLTVTQ